jgi:pimeloyl-ACP methyl ester carboxylesterase
MTEATTHTLEVPGAVLTYDVRPGDGTAEGEPALLLFGSPMGAEGFEALADRFPERTVVTYDPRGAGRSTLTSGEAVRRSTPQQHADDVHAVIEAVGAGGSGGGPVDVLASSGGAVNALALVTRHPDDVRTLVAHEPPLAQLLPDRERALAACVAIHETYLSRGSGPAMARFIGMLFYDGPLPDVDDPRLAPDPSAFGLATQDDGGRDDVLLAQNLISCSHYEPDLEALRASSTRIVVGIGADSGGQFARRGGEALADRLGIEPVTFPRDHGGFLGETSIAPAGDPDGFAEVLRKVLDGAG